MEQIHECFKEPNTKSKGFGLSSRGLHLTFAYIGGRKFGILGNVHMAISACIVVGSWPENLGKMDLTPRSEEC